jgi:hypothetical protein
LSVTRPKDSELVCTAELQSIDGWTVQLITRGENITKVILDELVVEVDVVGHDDVDIRYGFAVDMGDTVAGKRLRSRCPYRTRPDASFCNWHRHTLNCQRPERSRP